MLAVYLLSAAGFTVVTTEFVIVGLLPAMARDLGVSIYGVMALARLLPALALPVFWSLASETVVNLAGPEHAGRAVARFGVGIILAIVGLAILLALAMLRFDPLPTAVSR